MNLFQIQSTKSIEHKHKLIGVQAATAADANVESSSAAAAVQQPGGPAADQAASTAAAAGAHAQQPPAAAATACHADRGRDTKVLQLLHADAQGAQGLSGQRVEHDRAIRHTQPQPELQQAA